MACEINHLRIAHRYSGDVLDGHRLLVVGLLCPTELCGRPPEILTGAVPMGCDRAHNGHSESSQLRRFWSDRQIGVLGCPSEVVGGSDARRAASFVLVLISA
jgi:hypothetical protein